MIYTLNGITPRIGRDVFIAPNATVIADVDLGDEASIWFGAVLRGDIECLTVGRRTNVQDNTVMHSDRGSPLTLGDRVTVGHSVVLHGCTVGDGSLIGMGSSVLNDARIGRNCLVGANALVTEGKTFADGMLIVGSPARAIRPLTPEELARLAFSADHYAERAALYRRTLKPFTPAAPGSAPPASSSPRVPPPR